MLERAIGVTPQTVIPLHHFRRAAALSLIAAPVDAPRAAVVQWHELMEEPAGFGEDAGAIWTMLQSLSGWKCIEVDLPVAPELQRLMMEKYPRVRLYNDIHYVLSAPDRLVQPPTPDLETRLLAERDLPMLERAPRDLHIDGFGSNVAGLRDGVAAGSILDGEIVAIAEAGAFAGNYADVGVYTVEVHRLRGLSTYASWLVMRELTSHGLTPIWSTGADNWASRRVAEKLGLKEVTQRVYLIPEWTDPA